MDRRRLMTLVLRLSNRWLIRPLLAQDGFAVEAEQRAWEAHADRPVPDLNPAVGEGCGATGDPSASR